MPKDRSCSTLVALAACCLLTLTTGAAWSQEATTAEALGPPYLSLNGQVSPTPSSPPILTAGELLAPVEDFFDLIGGDLTSDTAAGKYTVTRNGTVIEMTVDQPALRVGNQEFAFTIYPVRVGGIVYVDVRDVVSALGGQYAWDAATMTGNAQLAVEGLGGKVVKGTLAYVDKAATPPFFLIRPPDADRPTPYVGATTVEYLQAAAGGTHQPATLEQLQAGDQIEVNLDAEDHVVRVLQMRNVVSGTIDYVGQGLILISTPQGKQHYNLAPDVVVRTSTGQPYDINALAAGQTVALTVNNAGPTALEIVVTIAQAPPPTPEVEPQIILVAPLDYAGPISRDGQIAVRLRGTAGGIATFDIGNQIQGIALVEKEPGDYYGTYVARTGDSVLEATVVGHLVVNGKKAPDATSQQAVTIDTTAPVVTNVSPRDTETVDNPSPTILVNYGDENGSGIDKAATSLRLDGKDVTADTVIDDFGASYQARNLSQGNHEIELRAGDLAGNRLRHLTRFIVARGIVGNIVSVQHDARQTLITGDTLTVTMEATEPGLNAHFVIGDNFQRVDMAQVENTSTYRGYYVVRAGDKVTNAKVTGYLVDGQGREYKMDATTRVTISTALPSQLAITSPKDGAVVKTEKVSVQGVAPPNRKVRVLVQYQELFKVKNLDSDTMTVDGRGKWQTKELALRLGGWKALLGVSEFTIVAQLLDANDKPETSKSIVVKLPVEEGGD